MSKLFGRRARAAALGLAALIAATAAHGQPSGPVPVSSPVSEAPAAPAVAPVPVADSPIAASTNTSADYVLGPADKVRITVYGEPALTAEYFVSSAGTVNIPLAGDVQAAGKTLSMFRDSVVKSLQDGYLKDPKVSVEVLTFRPFYILGEVVKPGQYPYTTGLTVFNAVATAGGFTYRANTHKVLIKRANEGGEKEFPLTSQTTISPGDTIRIPERFF